MIVHNNFRKLVRRFLSAKTDTSAAWPFIYDYTDITGYTGIDDSTDSLARTFLCGNTYSAIFIQPLTKTARTFSQMTSDTTRGCFCFAAIGNATAQEEDYALGEFITSGLEYSNTITRSYNLIITTTITNTTSSDISFNEIALIAHFYQTYSSTTATQNYWHGSMQPMNILLLKEQLATPQVVPANGSISIAYNLFGDITIS